MRNTIIGLSLSLLVFSCSKRDLSADAGGGNKDTLQAVSFLDVSYGSDEQQKVDVYLPAGRNEKTRSIVIVHGGGWTSGDKSDFNGYVAEFQKRMPGYALINVNYRLISIDQTHFSIQEDDMVSVMKFLKSKASDYSISQDVILLGISAGGQLALLQGYKHTDVTRPLGIVSFFGPTDLTRLYNNYSDSTIPWVLKKILGGTLQENPEAFNEASPINYATAAAPPTLMLHGDADPLVPVEQAYLLHNKLDSLKVSNQLVIYPGQGHGWTGEDLDDSFQKVAAFIGGL